MSHLSEQNPRELFLVRDIILKRNGFKTYEAFLQSEYWKSVVEKARKREIYTRCWQCGSKENIHLHHENYRWLLTKHELRSIRPVCHKCHYAIHEYALTNNCTFSRAREELWPVPILVS